MKLRSLKKVGEVWSLGLRVGYWPCIPGPFVQVNVGRWYRSFWLEQKPRCSCNEYPTALTETWVDIRGCRIHDLGYEYRGKG